jgi:uncharacterized iron-regulated protein
MLRARRRLVLALGALALAPACATRNPSLEGTIWDVRRRAVMGEGALVDALRTARYRLLGELHDNPAHHASRARLIDALGRSGLKPVVAFEQFDAVYDAALQELFLRRTPKAEEVAEAVRFDRAGWNWELYRPIVEAALRHGMPLRAANLSRSETMRIAKAGTSGSLPPWPAEREARLRKIIFDGHCGALPERAMPGMVAAQRARDAKLAEALLAPDRNGAVLIAGNGHVRRDLGVPLYLPGDGATNIGFIEVEPGKAHPRDYGELPFDYVWFTARTERPDPCEAFRRK